MTDIDHPYELAPVPDALQSRLVWMDERTSVYELSRIRQGMPSGVSEDFTSLYRDGVATALRDGFPLDQSIQLAGDLALTASNEGTEGKQEQ